MKDALKLLLNDYDVYLSGGKSLFDWSDKDKLFEGYGLV